jgi:hypothetical protein
MSPLVTGEAFQLTSCLNCTSLDNFDSRQIRARFASEQSKQRLALVHLFSVHVSTGEARIPGIFSMNICHDFSREYSDREILQIFLLSISRFVFLTSSTSVF